MEGLKIKFWDSEISNYIKEGWYVVNDDGTIMKVGLQGKIELSVVDNIEAHIYVDGMRVA